MELAITISIIVFCFFLICFDSVIFGKSGVKKNKLPVNMNKRVLKLINEYRQSRFSAPRAEMAVIKPGIYGAHGHENPAAAPDTYAARQLPVGSLEGEDIEILKDFFAHNREAEIAAKRHGEYFYVMDLAADMIIFETKKVTRTEGNRIFSEIKRIMKSV